jgi:hypothetical protein
MANEIDIEVQRSLGRIEGVQEQILNELKATRESLAAHIASDAKEFNALKADRDRAKGAGWVILGMLGSLAAFVGSAVVAVLGGWLKF